MQFGQPTSQRPQVGEPGHGGYRFDENLLTEAVIRPAHEPVGEVRAQAPQKNPSFERMHRIGDDRDGIGVFNQRDRIFDVLERRSTLAIHADWPRISTGSRIFFHDVGLGDGPRHRAATQHEHIRSRGSMRSARDRRSTRNA